MRRVPLRNGTNGTSNGGIIVVPPIVPPPVECESCPSVPPIADWADITELFACAGVAPDEATVAANGLFTATPGADLTANYAWEINTAGMTIPHVCCVIPTDLAVFSQNFRFMAAAGAYIQKDPPDNGILSPFFLIRPDGSNPQISAYQPNTSFGDPANGLLATVTFRVVCIPVEPA